MDAFVKSAEKSIYLKRVGQRPGENVPEGLTLTMMGILSPTESATSLAVRDSTCASPFSFSSLLSVV